MQLGNPKMPDKRWHWPLAYHSLAYYFNANPQRKFHIRSFVSAVSAEPTLLTFCRELHGMTRVDVVRPSACLQGKLQQRQVFEQGRCRLWTARDGHWSEPFAKFLISFHPFSPDSFGGHSSLFFHINKYPAENFKMSGKINDVLPSAGVHIQFLRVTAV